MRLLPKRGRYEGPVVYVDGFHYPADREGDPRYRLIRVEPDFEARHALVDGLNRNHVEWSDKERAAYRAHDAMPDTGWWEFHSPRAHGPEDHRVRYHREHVELSAS